MFYIGSNVLNWPYGALRGVKDGHHIAGHTWSHKMMTTLTNQEVLAELYYTAKAIKYVTGITPLYWRPVSNIEVFSIPVFKDLLLRGRNLLETRKRG